MQIDNSETELVSSDPAREEQKQRALSWTHQQREARRQDSGRNSGLSDWPGGTSRQMGENDDEQEMQLSPRDRSQGSPSSARRPSMSTDVVNDNQQNLDVEPSSQHAVSRRGGWQTLMVEAGGISAAISDESMRKLKYCLEWLQVRL